MKRCIWGFLGMMFLLAGVALAQDRMIIFFKDGKTQSIELEKIQKIEYQLQPEAVAVEVKNLALRKPARQSSIGWGGDPGRAVDGNRDGNYFGAGSVTHTMNAPNEWWEVDLERPASIKEIKLWNRTDCCPERLANFYVFVSSHPFSSVNLQETLNDRGVWRHHFPGVAGRETTIPVNRDGRYVRIQLAGQNYLSLAEVEILGAETAAKPEIPVIPEALPRPAGLVAWWSADGNANDIVGNRHGTMRNGAAIAAGIIGQAFRLDGADDFVDTGSWAPGPQWTVEAWVNPSATPTGRRTIAGGMNECRDWAIVMQEREFGVAIRPSGDCTQTIGSGITAVPGKWYHLVGTSDGTTAWIYVNGEGRRSAPVLRNYSPTATGMRIGGAVCCPGNNFPGLVDEVRVYNRALSPAEVASLYTAGRNLAGAPVEPIVAPRAIPVTVYWHMADTADLYLNGQPLRKYEPTFRTRRDEAPLPAFSAQATIKNGDVFTVGGRRGGSFGFMLIAVDAAGKVVYKTDDKAWFVYEPGERPDWFEPAVASASPRRPVTVQPDPWYPQRELNAKYNNVAASIWSEPGRPFAFLFGVVKLE